MSQLNSERLSLACDWQYRIEGDPFPKGPAGLDMGLTINPGIFIESVFVNIMEPITTTGNPAVDTVSIFFYANIFGVTLALFDTINNINARFLNTWYTGFHAADYALPGVSIVQNPNQIATPGVYQIFISSTAALTAGRIATTWNCCQLNIK